MQDGFLTVSVIDSNTNRPIEGATVNIYTNPTESGESYFWPGNQLNLASS